MFKFLSGMVFGAIGGLILVGIGFVEYKDNRVKPEYEKKMKANGRREYKRGVKDGFMDSINGDYAVWRTDEADSVRYVRTESLWREAGSDFEVERTDKGYDKI